jgi:hypothetical protein
MILEWLFTLVASLVRFVLGLFPPMPDVSSLSGSISSAVATLSTYASQVGNFVPWAYVKTCMGIVLAALLTAVVIRIVRIVASFFTAGGGSAA